MAIHPIVTDISYILPHRRAVQPYVFFQVPFIESNVLSLVAKEPT